MVKTPGQILFESQGSSRLEWASLDERVRKQFEAEGAAVWNAALDAASTRAAVNAEFLEKLGDRHAGASLREFVRQIPALKVQP